MAETNPNGRQCLICGYSKHIDRCHFIPKSITKRVEQLVGYSGLDNANIVFLCKNHHWELDHDSIADADFQKIFNYVMNRDRDFYEAYAFSISGKVGIEDGKRYSIRTLKGLHSINKWILKQRERFERMDGFIEGVPDFFAKFT